MSHTDQKSSEAPTASAPVNSDHEMGEIRSPSRDQRVQKWILVGLFTLIVFYAIAQMRAILLPVVLAVLFDFLLTPVTHLGRRIGLSESASAALIISTFAVAVGGAIYGLSGPALDWLESAPESLNKIREKFAFVEGPMTEASNLLDRIERLAGMKGTDGETVAVQERGPGLGTQILTQGQEFVQGSFFFLILLFFLLTSGDTFSLKLVYLMPRIHKEEQALPVVRRIQRGITRYLGAITLINLTLGLVTAGTMWLIGFENPLLWGALAGLFNYVPYLGPLVVIILLALVGLVNFDTMPHALLAPATFGLLNLVEAYFVTPMIIGRQLSVHPVAVILSLIFWGYLWGVAGALLAVPLLVIIKIVADNVPSFQPVSELLSNEQTPARLQPHE